MSGDDSKPPRVSDAEKALKHVSWLAADVDRRINTVFKEQGNAIAKLRRRVARLEKRLERKGCVDEQWPEI